MKKFEPKIYVVCPQCGYVAEEEVEFINIEEDITGRDKLTFICPECKQKRKSYRLGV